MTTSAATALGGLYDLATALDPRTVLGHGGAERGPVASESPARGRGSPRQRDTPIAPRQEPERMATHRPTAPDQRADGLLRVQGRRDPRLPEHATLAEPVGVQCGVRLSRCAPCAGEKRAPIARGGARSPRRAGTPEWRAHEGPGCARPGWFLPVG